MIAQLTSRKTYYSVILQDLNPLVPVRIVPQMGQKEMYNVPVLRRGQFKP